MSSWRSHQILHLLRKMIKAWENSCLVTHGKFLSVCVHGVESVSNKNFKTGNNAENYSLSHKDKKKKVCAHTEVCDFCEKGQDRDFTWVYCTKSKSPTHKQSHIHECTYINPAPLTVNFKHFKAKVKVYESRSGLPCLWKQSKKFLYSPNPPLSCVSAWCKLTGGRKEWNK